MSTKPSLAALKAKFKKTLSGGTSNYTGDIYPFWNMDFDESAVIRFLPDKNKENGNQFFVDKYTHTLNIDGKNVKVDCPKTVGMDEECPICDLCQRSYKEGNEKDGAFYWRKRQSIVQALVVTDPLPPNEETKETFAGKVVLTYLGPQVMKKVMHCIVNDFEDDEVPWNYDGGFNFTIYSSKSGKYADYGLTSNFDRKSSNLSDFFDGDITEELEDLSTKLPTPKSYEEIEKMLIAHIEGGSYDESGSDDDGDDADDDRPAPKKAEKTTVKAKAKAEEVDEVDEGDDDDSDEDDDDGGVSDILARIKNRKKK